MSQSGPEDDPPASDSVRFDAKMQDLIGRSLKAHYDDLTCAPIPDKFLELLARLEAKERGILPGDGRNDRG